MKDHLLEHDHHTADSIDVFGFWLYILSDCILFATLFGVFVVLRYNLFGQADILKFTDTSYVFIETITLLGSSFTFGLSMISMYHNKLNSTINWLIMTFILGAIFVGMELNEFMNLVQEGFNWQSNAALSAFFTLVGTHGLHVSIGLIWITAIIFQLPKFRLNHIMKRRMTYLGLFWAFLDIVWIFLFTIVYLMGVL